MNEIKKWNKKDRTDKKPALDFDSTGEYDIYINIGIDIKTKKIYLSGRGSNLVGLTNLIKSDFYLLIVKLPIENRINNALYTSSFFHRISARKPLT